MSPIGKLGDRTRVAMRPVVQTRYRVEWEYDGHEIDHDPDDGSVAFEPARKIRSKMLSSKAAAYRWMALRLVFSRRAKYATEVGPQGYAEGCRLCDAIVQGAPDYVQLCRYHDHDSRDFQLLIRRLARWLRWRDEKETRVGVAPS